MYAGTTFRRDSGRIVGVHQKIDRVARRHLKKHISKSSNFPTITKILHFEGNNGPDGIKRKSPSKDEPWHYIDPTKLDDRSLIIMINDHIFNLSEALKVDNQVRAAFEAAWLAHAIVDGLTPAHHYPLDDKIEELWGKPHDERLTVKDKNFIRGDNRRDTFSKNWEYWGAKGVFTAHVMFELGIASTIAPQNFSESGPTEQDVINLRRRGFEAVFSQSVQKIYKLNMYNEFVKNGWTHHLANETRKSLIPEIIKLVCLGWCAAVIESEELV